MSNFEKKLRASPHYVAEIPFRNRRSRNAALMVLAFAAFMGACFVALMLTGLPRGTILP